MKILGSSQKCGFALLSTLLFLPLALLILIFSVQLLFFNKIKNEILQDCFLYSLENVEISTDNLSSTIELNKFLAKKFKARVLTPPLDFFVINFKFEPIQSSNTQVDNRFVELATGLQFSVLSKNINFKSFSQSFKCGAFLKWKNTKKIYGIIAVKY